MTNLVENTYSVLSFTNNFSLFRELWPITQPLVSCSANWWSLKGDSSWIVARGMLWACLSPILPCTKGPWKCVPALQWCHRAWLLVALTSRQPTTCRKWIVPFNQGKVRVMLSKVTSALPKLWPICMQPMVVRFCYVEGLAASPGRLLVTKAGWKTPDPNPWLACCELVFTSGLLQSNLSVLLRQVGTRKFELWLLNIASSPNSDSQKPSWHWNPSCPPDGHVGGACFPMEHCLRLTCSLCLGFHDSRSLLMWSQFALHGLRITWNN